MRGVVEDLIEVTICHQHHSCQAGRGAREGGASREVQSIDRAMTSRNVAQAAEWPRSILLCPDHFTLPSLATG